MSSAAEVANVVTTDDDKQTESMKISSPDDDDVLDVVNRLKAEALVPLQEDLSTWLNGLLGPELDINVENFLDRLDSGVHLCRLAEIIASKSHENQQKSTNGGPPLPGIRNYNRKATSGSWFARDNTANFISWCRSVAIKEECLFETDGLVLHRDLRNVILCLLELARIGGQYGLEVPTILKLEKEIELEEQDLRHDEVDAKAKAAKSRVQAEVNSQKRPRPKSQSSAKGNKQDVKRQPETLDKQVMNMSGKCRCKNSCNQIKKISEGRYAIGQKVVYVRLLNDRHLMVRVGGGWDTLQHYLAVHDPCKMKEIQREGTNLPFLFAQGKYKLNKMT